MRTRPVRLVVLLGLFASTDPKSPADVPISRMAMTVPCGVAKPSPLNSTFMFGRIATVMSRAACGGKRPDRPSCSNTPRPSPLGPCRSCRTTPCASIVVRPACARLRATCGLRRHPAARHRRSERRLPAQSRRRQPSRRRAAVCHGFGRCCRAGRPPARGRPCAVENGPPYRPGGPGRRPRRPRSAESSPPRPRSPADSRIDPRHLDAPCGLLFSARAANRDRPRWRRCVRTAGRHRVRAACRRRGATSGRTRRRGDLCQVRCVRAYRARLDDAAKRAFEAVALYRHRRTDGQYRCQALRFGRRKANDGTVLQQRAVEVAARAMQLRLDAPRIGQRLLRATRTGRAARRRCPSRSLPVASFLTDIACTIESGACASGRGS